MTIKLRKDTQERVPAGTPIQLTIGWLANTEEQVTDFLIEANMTGTLNGKPLSNLNGAWGKIEPQQGNGYISRWLYSLGSLGPGSYTVEILCTLNQPVTDGYDSNNDGQLDEYSGEIWRFSMQIEVY